MKDGKETLDFYEVLLTTTEKKVEVQILADGKVTKREEEKRSRRKRTRTTRRKNQKNGDAAINDRFCPATTEAVHLKHAQGR